MDYGAPLFISFYNDAFGKNMSRIGDYYDIPLDEAVKALNCQTLYTRCASLIVRFEACREEDIAAFTPVLRLLLFRCEMGSDVAQWCRCTLMMANYDFAERVVALLVKFAGRILELNIGSVQLLKEKPQRCDPEREAECVQSALALWLDSCYKTLRCLRIFAFIRLDTNFSFLLKKCQFLKHLTLARVTEAFCPYFHHIESFEFNGCGMGYTEEDIALAKNLVKYFPAVKTIGLREVCFEPLVTSATRHLSQTGLRFELYQIVPLKQFASLVKSAFTVVSLSKDNGYMEMVSERYGTRLIVRDHHQIHRIPYLNPRPNQ